MVKSMKYDEMPMYILLLVLECVYGMLVEIVVKVGVAFLFFFILPPQKLSTLSLLIQTSYLSSKIIVSHGRFENSVYVHCD